MSIAIVMDVNEFDKIPKAMRELDEALKRKVEEKLLELAERMYQRSQGYVPVVTGFLKSTGGFSVEDWRAIVFYTAYYAGYVERGTRYFQGRRFLLRAFWEIKPYILPYVEQAIKEAILEVKSKWSSL